MTRIKDTFLKLKKSNKKALVSYLVAGDPDLETSLRIMHLMTKEGVDLIELGVPFSDPMAEGVSIQKGYERALVNGVSLEDSLSLIKKFRKKDKKTPIILMGYMNPFDSMGSKVFCRKASKSGLDGILIVDMPPGTGDAQITVSQHLPLDGAIIISTPQAVALNDAKKAIGMFNKVNIRILGIVENMSYFLLPDGQREDIFGKDGAKNLAANINIDFLGSIPLDKEIRINSDQGDPTKLKKDYFNKIANKLIGLVEFS